MMIVEGRAFAALLASVHGCCYPPAERWGEAAMQALLDVPGCFASLDAAEGDAPTGMALLRVTVDEAEILTIAVMPDHRGQGAGAALLDVALAEAARRGAVRVLLEVSTRNVPALALYRRQGFIQVGRRSIYYPDGTDALVMQRALSAADVITPRADAIPGSCGRGSCGSSPAAGRHRCPHR